MDTDSIISSSISKLDISGDQTTNNNNCFNSYEEVKQCYNACGGPSNPLVNKSNCVYLVTDGKRVYCGVTNNVRRRVRQHKGLTDGGARTTKGMRSKGKSLRHIAIVTGFQDYGEAMRFERRCHKRSLPKDKSLYYEELKPGVEQGCNARMIKHPYVKILYTMCMLKKWYPKSKDASSSPLTINWFDTRHRAFTKWNDETKPKLPHLPDYISERNASEEENKYINFHRPRENKLEKH
jgi:predicted GIY-YIG superfamily endonuclease